MLCIIDSLAQAGENFSVECAGHEDDRTLLFSDPTFHDLIQIVPSALEAARPTLQEGASFERSSFCAGYWITTVADNKGGVPGNICKGRRRFMGRLDRARTTVAADLGQSQMAVDVEMRKEGSLLLDDMEFVITRVKDMTLAVDGGHQAVMDSDAWMARPSLLPSSRSAAKEARGLPGGPAYACEICGATFALRRTLTLHRNRNGCAAIRHP